jgi:energy-coupling factor transporter ATP-binding protein EcfA2
LYFYLNFIERNRYFFVVDYYSIFAERYDELAKDKTDRVLPDIEFVLPVFVSQTQRNEHKKITTPQVNINEITGRKNSAFKYADLLSQKSGSRLLLQGRPGCGKTRLTKQVALELARTNRNSQNGKFVIFVKLREMPNDKFEDAQKYMNLLYTAGDKLSKDEKKTLLTKFESQGSNVIFIFDGFDEYDEHTGTSLVSKIFLNKEPTFAESIVIMSSRPSTTCHFQEEDHVEIVEVIGFKEAEVFEYLRKANKEELRARLDSNPKVMNICYLPLHCAMLVKMSRDDNQFNVPRTESEFYEKFILFTFHRYYRKKKSENQVNINHLSDLRLSDHEAKHGLEYDLKHSFKEICQLAYGGTIDSKHEFTPPNFSSRTVFDLLVTEQVVSEAGALGKSYSFVHLTFREYFTAVYIAWYLDESQQNTLIANYCKKSAFLVVWQFLAGILEPFSKELFSKIQGATPNQQLLHVRCAYESQHDKTCAKVLDFHHNSLTFDGIHPSDLPCLTFVLKNTPAVKCKLRFQYCDFSVKDAYTFLKGIGNHQLSLTIQYVDAVYCCII